MVKNGGDGSRREWLKTDRVTIGFTTEREREKGEITQAVIENE